MRRRLAWMLFGLTCAVAVTHVAVLVAGTRPLLDETVLAEGFPLVTLGALGGALVGALIISRYPGHPIGWLFLVGQLLSELGVALGDYGYAAAVGDLSPAPGGQLAVWFSVQLGGLLVVALLGVLFLLAPDGRLASRRWSVALVLTVTGLAANVVIVMTVAPSELDATGQLRGTPSVHLMTALLATTAAVFAGVLAGAISMWLRLRRSAGEERQQLQLMVMGAFGLVVGMAVNAVASAAGAPTWVRDQPLMGAYACLMVLTAVAILRYRLYDIDLVLTRAITLTLLTGFITVGYVTVVVLIGTALPFTRGLFWPSLLATALVALAAQPARERAQRTAARLVYGARAAPYVELAEFSKRLQESPDTDDLLRRVAESVVGAVGARRATISFDLADRTAREVTWPEQVGRGLGETTTVPVADASGSLGRLTVTMPPRTSLRAEDRRLLEDFTVQLAQAFRNVRLESALAHQVYLLRQSTEGLAASARRLARAREAERRRFEKSLTSTVVPHLQLVRDGLLTLVRSGRIDTGTAHVLQELTTHARTALESLRELTRGVFPTQLERRGLVPALDAYLASQGSGPVRTDVPSQLRLSPGTEVAAYFCVVEFLRGLDGPASVELSTDGDHLRVRVTGPSPVPPPSRVEPLEDRAAALGGSLTVDEEDGRVGMVLRLPCRSAWDEAPESAQAVGVEVGLGDIRGGAAGQGVHAEVR